MAFADLAKFEDPDLHLMFRRKHYTVPAASISTGRYLHKIYAVGLKAATKQDITEQDAANLNDDQEREFIDLCLGEELLATLEEDRVPYKVVSLMAQTLLFDTVADRATAEAFWASGGKAPAPEGPKTGTRTRKAAATTTRKPASPNGTKPAAKAPSGRTSSKTGGPSKPTSTKSTV